jgi:hypothetical protein
MRDTEEKRKRLVSSIALLDKPPQRCGSAALPPEIPTLNTIQRHVLARVATHCWRFKGEIPYVPPTRHQAMTAYRLSLPGVCLLKAYSARPAFRLTRLGDAVAQQIFTVTWAPLDIQREIEVMQLEYLMYNEWEAA